jgi:superfamily II DNA or RNA helicase
MVRLVINNATSQIVGTFHTDYEVSSVIQEELRNALSYEVSGAEWSEKYKDGTWDGKISLYSKRDKSFPTGLLFRVKQTLEKHHIEYVSESKRVKPVTTGTVDTTFAAYNRTLRPYQELAIEAATQRGRGILSVATGGGKALALDTPILTKNRGWITMKDIASGDVVFDENGNECNVLMAHSILYGEKCYRVSFSDGSQIITSEDHLWKVQLSSKYDKENTDFTLTTSEILSQIKLINAISSYKFNRYWFKKPDLFFIECPIQINYPSLSENQIILKRNSNNLKYGFDIFSRLFNSKRSLKRTEKIYIKSVVECESVPVRCITVDSYSKLYLAGKNLIPTHNTMISAELLARLSALPAVFIVPSKTLMYQTQKEFQKYITIDGKPAKIGIAGDGVCEIDANGINVLTWQTALQAFDEKYTTKGDKVVYDEFTGLQIRKTKEQLMDDVSDATRALSQAEAAGTDVKTAKAALKKAQLRLKNREQQLLNKSQIKELIRKTPVFIVDEAHTAAVIIQRLGEHANNSYYRFGVTATAWREDNQEIRIEGTFGRILVSVKPSDLIRDGFLVRPYIFMVNIKHTEPFSDYNDAYNKHVINCWERNYRIKQFAEELHARGRRVLILVERLEHGENLEQMVYNSVFVPGKDDGSGNETITDEVENYRLEMLARCGRGEHILIATQWANVGVDEPGIDSLILAGSNQSSVTTFQQVGRILRPAPNKENAIVIDFNDSQKDLHKHSLQRRKAYALEEEFKVFRVQ